MDIRSRRNPKIQRVRRLQSSARARRAARRFVAEGVRLAEEALRAGWLPEWVLFTPDLSPRGQAVVAAFREQGVPAFATDPEALAAASATETPQGILLVLPIRALPLPTEADFLLVVDGVRDPGNLGTILRTAWAAGVEAALLTPDSADPFNPKVVRAGMGAHFRLPLRREPWESLRKHLTHQQVYVAAADGALPYTHMPARRPIALVVGGEAEGVGPRLRRFAHQTVAIPMPGHAESLNAAVAAGILLFEVVRQREESNRSTFGKQPADERGG